MVFHNLRYSSFMKPQLFTLLDLFPQVLMLFFEASELFNNFIHKAGNTILGCDLVFAVGDLIFAVCNRVLEVRDMLVEV